MAKVEKLEKAINITFFLFPEFFFLKFAMADLSIGFPVDLK